MTATSNIHDADDLYADRLYCRVMLTGGALFWLVGMGVITLILWK